MKSQTKMSAEAKATAKGTKRRLLIVVAITLALILLAGAATYYFIRTSSQAIDPGVIEVEQAGESLNKPYTPLMVRNVNAELKDDQIGYSLQATEVVVDPFEDKSSITNSNMRVVLVKYVINASTESLDSPVGNDIQLIDASGAEISPSTLLIEGRMKDNGYTPGPTTIGMGEIRTGYEAYFVNKSAMSSLKISYTRQANQDLPEKTFTATLLQ